MTVAQRTANFQFLTDGKGLLGSDNLKFADSSTLSALHRLHVEDGTQVHLQFVGDELLQFLLAERFLPAVEVDGFLIIVVEHLGEDFLILRVAESWRIEADPFLCLFLIGQIWQCMFHTQGDVANRREISLRCVLPAILEFLGDSAAAFRESCVADFFAVHQNLPLGLADGFGYMRRSFFGDALVALAVVVGTDIKEGMVFAVVPADECIFLPGEGEEVVAALSHLSALLHLCQKP